MAWVQLFFALSGRLRRSSWWASTTLLLAAFITLSLALDSLLGRMASLALLLPFGWMSVALAIKRLHDGGRSTWQLLWLLVPVFGPLLIAFRLTCLRGTVGENQYGEDPYIVHRDYLQVKIHTKGPT
ncbi:DUF805 domain-containing protein [Vogesella sp. GCM10023246]|uniref:DUF805 domain-containing protein n=1 Tax=Vogesella oryzagri TaxID=3160864 RepID=A0ABV1M377_9NEIS